MAGRIIGMEALVRWQHPEHGLVPPGEFIPVAEDTGCILPLGRRVLREACRQAADWHRACPSRAPGVSVNLPARQFTHGRVRDEISEAVSESSLAPSCLTIETTETIAMDEAESHLVLLEDLQELGINIAMDDFGTGYSSLGYLKRFPVNLLKIDRSFVSGLGRGSEYRVIVQAVITLGTRVLAEGIKTAEQLGQLRALGCELGQGHYFSRPLAVAEAKALVLQRANGPKRAVAAGSRR